MLETISTTKIFEGTQGVFTHESAVCQCTMRFAVFVPPQARDKAVRLPVLFWLSGLTCTEENFITKAGAQKIAAELGLVIVAPDTSPRGPGVPDDP
ncbi:MAG: alpha/beta hydrolase-fold protein, partial [Pseudomonadota bacterium]